MEKKYWVKDGMKFNLDSMHTKVQCFLYDMEDGKIKTVEIMGEIMDYDRLYEFKLELEDLTCCYYGAVDGKTYGRIKAISDARDIMRYATCMANGMNERDAGYAFMG